MEEPIAREMVLQISLSPRRRKTFFAKRLVYLLLGERDPDRVDQVQFHQSYSYEATGLLMMVNLRGPMALS